MASAKIVTTGCLGYIIFSDGSESERFSSVLEGVTIIAKSLAQEKLTEKEAETLISKTDEIPLLFYDEEPRLVAKPDNEKILFNPHLN